MQPGTVPVADTFRVAVQLSADKVAPVVVMVTVPAGIAVPVKSGVSVTLNVTGWLMKFVPEDVSATVTGVAPTTTEIGPPVPAEKFASPL